MIFLRKLKEGDLKLILNWKKKRQYLNKEHSLTMEYEKKWLAKIEVDNSCEYWIINNGAIKIGIAGINHIDVDDKSCNLECIIEEKYFKNRGINNTVIFNLLDYTFNKVNMGKVYINMLENKNIFNRNEITLCNEKAESKLFSKSLEVFGHEFIQIEKVEWEKFKECYLLERIDID